MTKYILLGLAIACSNPVFAQEARIREETKEIPTYPFSDPNPVASLSPDKKKIYPYFSFDGYTTVPQSRPWKVITLENDFVAVYVLPEAGGKVWGAIDKSTGRDFIYRNDVMKFRNVSLRGPWTSGGIEFNFGIIGHTPSTAAPVDYKIVRNDDGSVSCFVGNLDLPSRTQWRVEIRLAKDKAYFETRAYWDNPTPFSQSYYNWMTGAARVSGDLEFYYPGNQALEHNGEARPWPVDEEGHDLSKYAQDAFGSEKSLHTVGEYKNFMGGYYRRSGSGFGHWALYDDMPGHKLWVWSQSRAGEIWKDLLTDRNGQYMEFQAGRGFNQYAAGAFRSPLAEMSFPPLRTDRWKEIWFPVGDIGGISDASPEGLLHVTREKGVLHFAIEALAFVRTTVVVRSGGKEVYRTEKEFKPRELLRASVPLGDTSSWEVAVPEMGLHDQVPDAGLLARPFVTSPAFDSNSASLLFREGCGQKNRRNYAAAADCFSRCLEKDRFYIDAYAALAELFDRRFLPDSALRYAREALRLNSYHAAANYYAAIAYAQKNDGVNSLECFGWAARSPEFRSAAYTGMSDLALQRGDFSLARHYAKQALDANRVNVSAWLQTAVACRKSGDTASADLALREIAGIDPLSHAADFERYRLRPTEENKRAFAGAIRNEFPEQAYLEISIACRNRGLPEEARDALALAPENILLSVWRAYLEKSDSLLDRATKSPVAFVFPYRTETWQALDWAVTRNGHWKLKYLLALNARAIDRDADAAHWMAACGNEPDLAAFYATRAMLSKTLDGPPDSADLIRALRLDSADWRNWSRLIDDYDNRRADAAALACASRATALFPANYNLSLAFARALMDNGAYARGLAVLKKTQVLPFEGAQQGKTLWESGYLQLAAEAIRRGRCREALQQIGISKAWPENLGEGRPYEPDERRQLYLEEICARKKGRTAGAKRLQDSLLRLTLRSLAKNRVGYDDILALRSLRASQDDAEAASLQEKIDAAPDNAARRWILACCRKPASQPPPAAGLPRYDALSSILAIEP